VDEWPLDACDWADVCAGATRSYKRGRTAQKAARKSGVMTAYASEADRLGELLGKDHDLAVLASFLAAHGGALDMRSDLEEFGAPIAQRRSELQAEARVLGRRPYADSPKAFGRRLEACVRARHDERAGASALV
jgi:hypothetical protein